MGLIDAIRAERLIDQVSALSDLEDEPGKEIVRKLRSLDTAAIPKLIERLGTTRREEYQRIVEVLRRLVSEENLHFFMTALESDDSAVVGGVVQVLKGASGLDANRLLPLFDNPAVSKPALLAVLLAHAKHLNAELLLRQSSKLEHGDLSMLFRILGEAADESFIPKLVARLDARNPVLRSEIARFLSRFNSTLAQRALHRLLKDESKAVRLAALEGLTRIGATMDVGELCELLRDADLKLQAKAVDALIQLNHPDTVRYLVDLLQDESEYVRRAAVEVLNEIADSRAIKYLLSAVKDKDWWVRSRAADALGKVGGARVIDAVVRLIQDEDPYIRRSAIEVMSALIEASNRRGDRSQVRRSFPHLLKALQDPDWWVRERAVDSLAELGDKRAVPVLIRLLEEESATATGTSRRVARRQAQGEGTNEINPAAQMVLVLVRALAKLGSPEAIDAVLKHLREGDEVTKKAALEALRDLTDERHAAQVTAAIQEAVRGGSEGLLAAADEALRAIERRCAEAERAGTGSAEHAELLSEADSGIRRPAGALQFEEVDPSRLKPGDVIGDRYRFVRQVGKGAFGAVYLMQDLMVDEQVILKFLNPQMAADEAALKRFIYELRFARRVTHPNVIRIYDMLQFGEAAAISMEYFPSHTVTAEIEMSSPMDVKRALRIVSDVCEGMIAAHSANVIHRDLKPSNILIDDQDHVKIVDFGVAAASRDMETKLTRTGLLVGTPTYMAPEQVLGKPVDARTDIYALGVIMYEMLTGAPPYRGGDSMSIMYQHVQGKAEPPKARNPKLPHVLSAIVMRAMAVSPEKRYQSMAELRDRINEVLQSMESS